MISFVKEVIYNLKQEYGGKVTVFRETVTVPDITTGVKVTSTESVVVNKAARLPKLLRRVQFHDTMVDSYDLCVIIEASDLGSFEPRIDDYLLVEDETLRYKIMSVKSLDYNVGYEIG